MAADPNAMTFDALTSVHRVERGSSTLSAVRRDLYPAMLELLNAQARECDRLLAINPDSIMYDGATERKRKTIQLIKKIVEIRMNKISLMAMRGSMGANNIIDALTPEEKDYYNSVLESSKKLWSLTDRKRRTASVDITSEQSIEKREPTPEPVPEPEPKTVTETVKPSAVVVEEHEEEMPPAIPMQSEFDEIVDSEEIQEEPTPEPVPEPKIEEPVETEDEPTEMPEPADAVLEETFVEQDVPAPAEETVVIRVMEDLPPFSGPERDYDLKKEDIVRMPTMMAMALVSRGKAKLIITS